MKRSYRFLSSGRWVGLILTGLIVVVTCIFLGLWQWGRYEYKKELVTQFDAAYDAPVTQLSDVIAAGVTVSGDREWQPVELTGTWAPEQILIRNRAVGGENAYRVLALLHTDSVDVLVDRGWIPVTDDNPAPPPLPAGTAHLTGRLRPAEPVDTRGIAHGQAQSINPEQLVSAIHGPDASASSQRPVLYGYVQVSDGMEGLGSYPKPERNLGPHLSYAFQWWVFALGTIVGLTILARREAAENAGEVAPKAARTSLESEEDALVETQLR